MDGFSVIIKRMDSYPLLIQSIAIIALGLFSFSFHTKTRKGILSFQLFSFIAWFVHFYLLGAWTGAVLIILNAIITIFFLYKDEKRWINNYIFLSVSILSLAIATLLTWQGYFSLFAFLALSAITLAKWQSKPSAIRKVSILASIFWITYDAFVGSYGGILSELVIIISIIYSLLRKDKVIS